MTSEQPQILVVGKAIEDLGLLENILADQDVSWKRIPPEDTLSDFPSSHHTVLIFIDVQNSGSDELEIAEWLRSHETLHKVPIIYMVPQDKKLDYIFSNYDSGPVDYVFKPLNAGILKSKIKVFLELYFQKAIIAKHNVQLKSSNQQILDQQKLVIEEERFKALLQMMGATVHELRQPLTAMQGNIELIKLMEKNDPGELALRLDNIEKAGWQIENIIRKMQTIRRDDIKSPADQAAMVKIQQDVRILAVEDSDADYDTFRMLVERHEKLHISRAQTISEAYDRLRENHYNVVFLDYMLPDGTGLDFLKRMKLSAMEIPVIAITGQGDELVASQMIKAGAYDYLPKAGLKEDYFLRSISSALEKFRLKMEIEQATQKLAQMATVDQLTGLYNRRFMGEVLEREFSHAIRYGNDLACLLLDLDFFKEVNDNLGHGFGDFVLQRFGRRLTENMRNSDACFRYGGEEFLVLLPQTDIKGAKSMAEKIRRICENYPYNKGSNTVIVTVSIGITSLKQQQAIRSDDLLMGADKALYKAKSDGRNRVEIYSEKVKSPFTGWNVKSHNNRLTTTLEKSKKATVESLSLLIENMGEEKYKIHNKQVLKFLDLIGARLDLPIESVETLKHSAIFHDCSRILLGLDLLNKKEPLAETEKIRIKNQPYLMAELIEPLDFFAQERAILLNHHENFDGSGYPKGLKGEEIPLGARILSIAYAMTAMISERPYRSRYTADEAIHELIGNAGTQFDPVLVGILLDVIRENNLLDVTDEMLINAKEKLVNSVCVNPEDQK